MSQTGLELFYLESKELLQSFEDVLLKMDQGEENEEFIHILFRAMHTIKGSAGLFGFDEIVHFCHILENLLDEFRQGAKEFSPKYFDFLFQSLDHVRKMLTEIENSETISDDLLRAGNSLLSTIVDTEKFLTKNTVIATENCTTGAEGDVWIISVHFNEDILRWGFDPSSFLLYLKKLGDIQRVEFSLRETPWESFNPETCYMSYEIALRSHASKQEIEDVFDFIREDSIIRILAPRSKIKEYKDYIQSSNLSNHRLGDMLLKSGIITPTEFEQIIQIQTAEQEINQESARRFGQILLEENVIAPEVLDSALRKQAPIQERRQSDVKQLIKIDSNKLDKLISLVGELVIAGAGTRISIQNEDKSKIFEKIDHIEHLIEQVRDNTLGLRMVPIGEVFQRFPRVVRDLSKDLGKEIVLETMGAETELDKSLVEKLNDPLTHIIRNAMDHGIEKIEQRIALNKDPVGHLILNAYHDSGSVVVEISDDGSGLNAEKIRAKAIEKGIIQSDQELSQAEIFNLIFAAGFSTAEEVTNISGRGVGMDVVKKTIQDLRGQIEIESELQVGTIFRIRLPLTLAIIDAFQIKVGRTNMVLPLELVQECINLPDNTDQFHDFIDLRGELLPIIDLAKLFDFTNQASKPQSIVVIHYANTKVGIIVHSLLGELQAVIKSLPPIFKKMQGISGSTILGSGEVAFLLDTPQLVRIIQSQEHSMHRSK